MGESLTLTQKVIDIIRERLNPAATLNDSFEELGADSLDMVDLLLAVEEKQKVKFNRQDTTPLETVRDLVLLTAKAAAN